VERADAHRRVDALLDQVPEAITEDELPRHGGVHIQVGGHHGREVEATEHARRRHDEAPGRDAALGLRGALGLCDIREDAPSALEEAAPCIGERHRARRALQEPRSQVLLEGGHLPRDDRGREPEAPRGRCKPAQLGDGDEDGHGLKAVHTRSPRPRQQPSAKR
jgi:hypothetical protein